MPATSPAKAVLAAVAAFLASFLATVQGRTDLGTMKAIDWIIVLLSAAVTGLGVYLVPNRPTGTRRNEVGASTRDIALAALLLLIVLLVLAIFTPVL